MTQDHLQTILNRQGDFTVVAAHPVDPNAFREVGTVEICSMLANLSFVSTHDGVEAQVATFKRWWKEERGLRLRISWCAAPSSSRRSLAAPCDHTLVDSMGSSVTRMPWCSRRR